jgi:Tol biopolymer transport system component/DNA-binding winged helix-turn-helix (wHTH) protein
MSHQPTHLYEFGPFRMDAGECLLLRDGQSVPLKPKAFDVLLALVEQPGHLLEKDELMKKVWSDTFVEEANLSYNISLIRKALGEGENGQKYIETVPRRGYRFVAGVKKIRGDQDSDRQEQSAQSTSDIPFEKSPGVETGDSVPPRNASKFEHLISRIKDHKTAALVILLTCFIAIGTVAWLLYLSQQGSFSHQPPQRKLWQLTFDAGLQGEPTWSPDGRFIAYSSDRSGNLDIWVQPVGEGNPVQVTTSPAHDWQPDYSPQGDRIVFRSEREDGGLFIVPVLGGSERRISSFGYRPRWSSDGSQILFLGSPVRAVGVRSRLYVAGLDGKPPREVLAEFLSEFAGELRVAWHPDSKRVSIWGVHRKKGLSFWTISVSGGSPVMSERDPAVEQRLREDVFSGCGCRSPFGDFVWAPSGLAVYFDGISQGPTNVWKVGVDPQTLRWVMGPERLTTGPGLQSDISASGDGRKLSFTARTEQTRIWSIPFDATTGRVLGTGQAVSEGKMDAIVPDLSRDGKKLVFKIQRADQQKYELRERSLEDASERLLVIGDEFNRGLPRWSPNGDQLVFIHFRQSSAERGPNELSMVLLPAGGGKEQTLTSPIDSWEIPWDWSADGEWILASSDRKTPNRLGLYLFPIAAAPHAETQMRPVISHPDYNLWEGRFSPDGRWVSFNATKALADDVTTIYVAPATGGEWRRISEGRDWDDKPVWAPDGKTIYFLSNRAGFFNVWGIRFDTVQGKSAGEPFRVTAFDKPSHMMLPINQQLKWSLSANHLALPVTEVSGNIWILENVDR